MPRRWLAMTTIALLFLLAFWPDVASACPNCKDSLSQNDPGRTGMVQGYFWSILFMLAMPFTLTVAIGSYFLYLGWQAKATAPSTDQIIASLVAQGVPLHPPTNSLPGNPS